MSKGQPLPYPLDDCAGCRDLEQQLATVIAERDEQCAGKMAFFNGMNDMREQRTALVRKLATAIAERDALQRANNPFCLLCGVPSIERCEP